MEDLRSRSYGDGRMQMEVYGGGGGGGGRAVVPSGMTDMRCYSASYAYSQQQSYNNPQREMKLKKGKSMSASSSSSSSAPTSKLGWSFNDPEMQRKKRVAGWFMAGGDPDPITSCSSLEISSM
ncbi:hypothetical protein J5N97_019292 [Dioscorea zingiberensis]|uniref:Uncharacterized protein n=1 Tax=Dioscorea zingiberensis TaxID=325984 RepID=A0A9D5CEN7_9LILI|nr:hypothetical protein J5N97_019292 [Dioscorea zingiberensis]